MKVNDVDVAIVGAGPTGLAAACELRLAGVSCRLFERRSIAPNITRAFAVHARTLELLDARGLAEQLINRGYPVKRVQPLPGVTVDVSAIDSRYPIILIVPQSGTESLLEARATELGVRVERGTEVIGLSQDDAGVTLDLRICGRRRSIRAGYVIAADGAHSRVRSLIGVDFAGRQYQTHIMLADVELARPPEEVLLGAASVGGLAILVPFGGGWFRAIAWDRSRDRVPLDQPVALEELRHAFRRIAGDDFGMGEPRWRSRFLSERRQARQYRVGRVFLAGDAAHIHSPLGGQGMNTGIQDAFNLGWKLAGTIHRWAPPGLVESYHRERHQAGANVLALTDALNRLALSSTRLDLWARQALLRTMLRIGPVRDRLIDRLTGLGLRYPAGSRDHPLTGQRLPSSGDHHLAYQHLRDGRFVMIRRAPVSGLLGWADRLAAVDLPAAGGPVLLLVRPDGYVAWASDRPDQRAAAGAVRYWCGPPAAVPADHPDHPEHPEHHLLGT